MDEDKSWGVAEEREVVRKVEIGGGEIFMHSLRFFCVSFFYLPCFSDFSISIFQRVFSILNCFSPDYVV